MLIRRRSRGDDLASGLIGWGEATWFERGQMCLVWIVGSIFAMGLVFLGLAVGGQFLTGWSRSVSQHNACLQHATNGAEIERCR